MKSITEIIGGAQGLLDISYNVQDVFEAVQRPMLRSYRGTGRKPYQSQLFSTDTELIQRLKTDSALRLLCGFEKVPGKSTFSRNFGELSATAIMRFQYRGKARLIALVCSPKPDGYDHWSLRLIRDTWVTLEGTTTKEVFHETIR